MSMFKIMKEHTPISVYNNFVNRCSLLWNRFIGKVLEKCTPENSGVQIQGSTKNSDLCTPIPFVKNKLRNMLLDFQRGGDPNLWDPSNFCKY